MIVLSSALCLAVCSGGGEALAGARSPARKLHNDRVGYSLSYPRGWKVTGRVVATQFATAGGCQSVRVIDFRPPPGAGPAAQLRQSFVQICWRRAGKGSSLADFMRATYKGRVSQLFEQTTLGGVPAYRTRGPVEDATFFLQTSSYRLQIVAGVVADPARRAARVAQVRGVLASFSVTG